MKRYLVLILAIFCTPIFAQEELIDFQNDYDVFLKKYIVGKSVDYKSMAASNELNELIQKINSIEPNEENRKSFLINAYNLWVIKKVADQYPIRSVNQVTNFFDSKDVMLLGEKTSLNQLEKDWLFKSYDDPRMHFVLVCGAVDCPPIANYVYKSSQLDDQLDFQTEAAMNDRSFIKVMGDQISISEIFDWYRFDFGGNKEEIIQFINQYRDVPLSKESSIQYYDYDWTLNEIPSSSQLNYTTKTNSSNRYVVSAAIPKGKWEVKLFNNLYSQKTGEQNTQMRSTFLTSSLNVLYGVFNGVNLGINARIRKVKNEFGETSPFHVFGNSGGFSRTGITGIGPQIRFAPNPDWKNFSIQSTFTFPIGNDLEGNFQSNLPFIDWSGFIWNTQFFNDFTLNPYLSLFTEVDLLLEDFGPTQENSSNRLSTPATVILSYFPARNVTLYGLSGFSPFWQSSFDYFYQFGLGAKYQLSPNFELELLWTDFSNKFLNEVDGKAYTYNFGIRMTL